MGSSQSTPENIDVPSQIASAMSMPVNTERPRPKVRSECEDRPVQIVKPTENGTISVEKKTQQKAKSAKEVKPAPGIVNVTSITNYMEMLAVSRETASVKTKKEIPYTNITNLNSLLSDIFIRYIKLDKDVFECYYKVFQAIFLSLNKKMKEVDPYYNKYQSMIQFAGSHYDNLLLKNPNDFDVDIVIGLPLNIHKDPVNPDLSDLVIHPINAGFVELRMGPQFQNLPMRDGAEWLINKTAYIWKDDSHFLLQSKFLDWFKSVVNKALNTYESKNGISVCTVDGVEYLIKRSQAGPAMTLIIENSQTGFKLSGDLVPTLKFPENRWPISKAYQSIPNQCKKDIWMVVGKPNKSAATKQDEQRSWRIALHYQERELMHDTGSLRQVIRLIKKMRDALGMKKIASYYIKTLFFWEITKNDKTYWKQDIATLFKIMVRRLHSALVARNIQYFWNKSNNLIGHIEDNVLKNYQTKLAPLLEILEQPANYKIVAKYLLTPQEFKVYNEKCLCL